MYQLDDLLYTMRRLRNPQTGCPWDLKQDFASILPHTLEEAYEVADAIERRDWPHLEEELGDLLFQIIFYGQLGEEQQLFSVPSVIHKLVEKLVRRHPHVFPDGNLKQQRDASVTPDVARVNAGWESIKQQEKALKIAQGYQQPEVLLDEVPVSLPAITRAMKLQKKASRVGFDWPDIQGVVDKIDEELAEVKVELAAGSKQRQQDEIGDLLFAVVNLARHLDIDPEMALRSTNQRFYQRFGYVEQQVARQGGWQNTDLTVMEAAWQAAKGEETSP